MLHFEFELVKNKIVFIHHYVRVSDYTSKLSVNCKFNVKVLCLVQLRKVISRSLQPCSFMIQKYTHTSQNMSMCMSEQSNVFFYHYFLHL